MPSCTSSIREGWPISFAASVSPPTLEQLYVSPVGIHNGKHTNTQPRRAAPQASGAVQGRESIPIRNAFRTEQLVVGLSVVLKGLICNLGADNPRC